MRETTGFDIGGDGFKFREIPVQGAENLKRQEFHITNEIIRSLAPSEGAMRVENAGPGHHRNHTAACRAGTEATRIEDDKSKIHIKIHNARLRSAKIDHNAEHNS